MLADVLPPPEVLYVVGGVLLFIVAGVLWVVAILVFAWMKRRKRRQAEDFVPWDRNE